VIQIHLRCSEDPRRRADCAAISGLMKKVTKFEPKASVCFVFSSAMEPPGRKGSGLRRLTALEFSGNTQANARVLSAPTKG
jgi:hypothetical protein